MVISNWGANSNYVLLSKQTALHEESNVVSNNISNHGAVAQREFNLIYHNYHSKNKTKQDIEFAEDIETHLNVRQGNLRLTDNPTDLAIAIPNAYFAIEGGRYSRAGNFVKNADGALVTSHGDFILSEGGEPIIIPEDAPNFLVLEDGTIQAGTEIIGEIALVSFEKENLLIPIENGLFTTDQTALPVENKKIKQGFLEESNYSMVDQLTNMIEIQRQVEMVFGLIKQNFEQQLNLYKVYTKV